MKRDINNPSWGIGWTAQTRLTDLDFADDIALLAENKPTLQEMTRRLESEAGKIGLRSNNKKTKIMTINRKTKADIGIGSENIQEVENF